MGKHLITATITDKAGKMLAHETNNYARTHPIQARFARDAGQPLRIFLHAEIAAITKLRKGAKPHKISVSRYTKDGEPANAAPCPVCQAAIKHYGIKLVEYTV